MSGLKKIGLIDLDGKMPNLALMKLSTWLKNSGHNVSRTEPIFTSAFERVYASKVFTWTPTPAFPQHVLTGGPGSGSTVKLAPVLNNLCPDYSLYSMDYSLGFLTRGCPRRCRWCQVPVDEGDIRPEHDIEVFLRHKKAVLLDNNVLAHTFGIAQIEKIAKLGVRVDFNQGLDARLIDTPVALILSKMRWIRFIRVACDTVGMIPVVREAVDRLRASGVSAPISCYVLVEDLASALERVKELRGMGADPFAQPYIPPSGETPPRILREFARWVNKKEIFKSISFEEYCRRRGVAALVEAAG